MVNGLGVVGWGVGGIEAEAALLGQPITMLIPQVVGFKLTGKLPDGRDRDRPGAHRDPDAAQEGRGGKFVEFYGPGLASSALPDRATIANMAPEYGATIGFFPVDEETLDYLRFTGRPPSRSTLVEAYCKEQGLFHTDETPEPVFTDTLELDLATVVPSARRPQAPAGPRAAQDCKDVQKGLLGC